MTLRDALTELLAATDERVAAESGDGRPSGGFIPKPGTYEWNRRMYAAIARLTAAQEAARAALEELDRVDRLAIDRANKSLAVSLLVAASRSGDPNAITLAAQISGAAPCETCGYIRVHCRCGKTA